MNSVVVVAIDYYRYCREKVASWMGKKTTTDGREYYINHNTKITQWETPNIFNTGMYLIRLGTSPTQFYKYMIMSKRNVVVIVHYRYRRERTESWMGKKNDHRWTRVLHQ